MALQGVVRPLNPLQATSPFTRGPIAGIAHLKVDSSMYPLRGNLIIGFSEIERTSIAGELGVDYFETLRAPFIEADVSTIADLSVEFLQNVTDATVTAELINGMTYVLGHAWTKGPIDVDTYNGQFRIHFEGRVMEEMARVANIFTPFQAGPSTVARPSDL
jgi:hypothetical protein